MRDIIKKYGDNAGKIWNSLNELGNQSETSLLKNTKLTSQDFYTGVGWLARENKIYKSGSFYNLGETNLIDIIGDNAGKVWRLIDTKGQVEIPAIVKLNQIEIQDAYSALGWLAREDKITAHYDKKHLKFKLKYMNF